MNRLGCSYIFRNIYTHVYNNQRNEGHGFGGRKAWERLEEWKGRGKHHNYILIKLFKNPPLKKKNPPYELWQRRKSFLWIYFIHLIHRLYIIHMLFHSKVFLLFSCFKKIIEYFKEFPRAAAWLIIIQME